MGRRYRSVETVHSLNLLQPVETFTRTIIPLDIANNTISKFFLQLAFIKKPG